MGVYFKQKWYLILFVTFLFFNILGFTFQVVFGNISVINIIGLLIPLIVVLSFFLFTYSAIRVIVKVWAGLIIATGALGFFSSLLFFISGNLERIEAEVVLRRLLFFIFGIIIFNYWDKVTTEKAING